MALLATYFVIGLLVAVVRFRRPGSQQSIPRWLSLILCAVLWPLWGPLAFSQDPEKGVEAPAEYELAHEALADARAAVSGTPLSALLTAEVAERILGEIQQLTCRRQELLRLASTGPSSLGPRAEDVRLLELADHDTRRLGELVEAVRALRTRLVLARYSGASLDGVGDLLTELTTRVESLDEVFASPQRVEARMSVG